jgi:hypothetical protein
MGVPVWFGGKRAVAAVGITALAAALVLGGGAPAVADSEDDAQAVFCLGKGRAGLLDAAKAIGVTADGNVDAWRRDEPSEFRRVCAALYGSEKAPSPGWFSQALPFLTGLFGALLAYAATAWRERVNRGRKQGEDLRVALVEFQNAATEYLTAYPATKSDTAVLNSRAKLVSQLALLKAERRGWKRVGRLLGELREGSLGESFTTRSGQSDPAALRKAIQGLGDEVLLVATALARPLRSQRG